MVVGTGVSIKVNGECILHCSHLRIAQSHLNSQLHTVTNLIIVLSNPPFLFAEENCEKRDVSKGPCEDKEMQFTKLDLQYHVVCMES